MYQSALSGDQPEVVGSPELVVVTKSSAAISARDATVASASGAETSDLSDILNAESIRLTPLFSAGAEPGGSPGFEDGLADLNEMANYFTVDASPDRMEELAFKLNACESVDGAYVKPPAEQATLTINPPSTAAPVVTPNFRDRQGYLDPAPAGIDAEWAWSLPGGTGANVKIIDCEWGWNVDHEDLPQNNLGVVCGTGAASDNHGTAVWGEIGADHNGVGVMGITPDAELGASSFADQSTSAGIKCAADYLDAGDIILLEIHRPGPNATEPPQQGYIGIEWWPDDFAAIRYAVSKGIIVVEAAGNGWENLDDPIYDTPDPGFPSSWTNPFRLTNQSSGAVVVGAGDPPSGTHGRTVSQWNQPYVDRARCGFSNWGSRVDAQGWGWEVTTTGYGYFQNGPDRNRWYTDTFDGTSSASPIVTGALASTQGVLKAKGMPLLTSQRARSLLRSTGSPQQSAPSRPASQRIGNRPVLKQLIPAALKTWVNSATIRYCYALPTTQAAWAFIDTLGWRQIRTGAPDGVSNVFDLCCNVQVTGGKAHVHVDETYLYAIIQN